MKNSSMSIIKYDLLSQKNICVSELTSIGSDNGLSPGRRQAIIWNNAGLLLNEPLGTNFSEISIRIQTFSFKKMHLNMSSAKWRPFCLGLNVLTNAVTNVEYAPDKSNKSHPITRPRGPAMGCLLLVF